MLETVRQIRDMLSPRERRIAWVLVVLMMIGTLLESISVGMFVPVLAILADPTWLERTPALRELLAGAGLSTTQWLAPLAITVLVATYGIKTLYAAILAYLQARFVYSTQSSLSRRLYAGYVQQPWAFHLQRNSAQLIRNTIKEPAHCAQVLLALLQLGAELLLCSALGLLLVFIEPLGALVSLAMVLGASTLFQAVTRGRLKTWGKRRLQLDAAVLKELSHGLGGARDVKLLGCEPFFIQRFSQHCEALAQVHKRQQFTAQLPRMWLELVVVAGVACLVTMLVLRGGSFTNSLPTLGLFAAAALRLLPSGSRIIACLQLIRFQASSLGLVRGELARLESTGQSSPSTSKITVEQVDLRDVSFRYGPLEDHVLKSVSLHIPAGSIIGLIGHSGAGKSTLIDVMLGLLTPTDGRVLVNGEDVRDDPRPWQRAIGYVPQAIYLTDDTIRHNIALGRSDDDINDGRVWEVLEQAKLAEFVRSLPAGLNAVVGERGIRLSGGQRQRIGIARALYHNPDVLVLDEATSALDSDTESQIMRSVRALAGRKTVVVVTHRLSALIGCDHVYQLKLGRITVPEG
jgi:ABC-type multidrug transport system fused ATPase/permease subunit